MEKKTWERIDKIVHSNKSVLLYLKDIEHLLCDLEHVVEQNLAELNEFIEDIDE